MSQTLNSDDAFKLAEELRSTAVSVGNYRLGKLDQLTAEQQKALEAATWSLMNASATTRTAAVGLVLEETEASFDRLCDVTEKARSVLETLSDVRKGIEVAGAAVSLAGAIAARDPQAILRGTQGLIAAIEGAAPPWGEEARRPPPPLRPRGQGQ